MMPSPLRSLAAHHAETARLLGVDCIPAYRSRGGASPAGSSAPVAAAPVAPAPAPADEPLKASSSSPPRTDARAGSAKETVARKQAKLEEIRARYIADAPHKAFITAFTNIVFGEGDPGARLMFIGEAPGEEEDKTGRPFVGRAGQLLDKMIAAMGLERREVYIANILKTRPPNNATPTAEEARLCAPYLYDQIEAVGPEVIVTLGLPATRTILDVQDSMARLRGRWWAFRDPRVRQPREIPVMPTYHPAFLLRQYTPENRGKVWSDLQLVLERLGRSSPRA